MKVCFATNNANKIFEISKLVGDTITLVGLQEIGCQVELPETTSTIEGNSEQKARFVFEKFQVPCFADDTGLEVEALGGKPGVDTAHYAGTHRSSTDNMALLLSKMENVTNRKAQFKTVITYVDSKNTIQFTGVAAGTIAFKPQGKQGFGYDPIFLPDGHSISFAEMDLDVKNEISHRAKATIQLVSWLKTQIYNANV